jgi:hypothetical protein
MTVMLHHLKMSHLSHLTDYTLTIEHIHLTIDCQIKKHCSELIDYIVLANRIIGIKLVKVEKNLLQS